MIEGWDDESNALVKKLYDNLNQINEAIFELLQNTNTEERARVLSSLTTYAIKVMGLTLYYANEDTQGFLYKEMITANIQQEIAMCNKAYQEAKKNEDLTHEC